MYAIVFIEMHLMYGTFYTSSHDLIFTWARLLSSKRVAKIAKKYR